ncbi:MAG: BamA/TamA family outer membrane protein [Planctomycetes bacterium]|nr:BamA/TamA family outer membrane protein [Planctomycetota bacterium]
MALTMIALIVAGCGRDTGVDRIEILGNDRVSDSHLLAVARRELENWRKHRRRADLADAAYAMQSLLLERGHPKAEVEASDIATGARFMVIEGPRVHIDDVRFPGACRDRVDHLEEFVVAGSGLFGLGRQVFSTKGVEESIRKIEKWYLLDGHLRVRVGPAQERPNRSGDEVDLVIPVVEGPRYTVASVDVRLPADTGIDATAAAREARLVGKAFHPRMPEQVAARLRGWLRDLGRIEADVHAEATIDEDAHAVHLVFVLAPGPLTRLRSISVSGQQRTRERFIAGRFQLRPGDPLAQRRVDEGLRALYGSGLFNDADAEPVPAADAPGLADLVVHVDEKRNRRLDAEVGWGSYEQLRGRLGWADDNLFGTGRHYDLGARASLRGWGAGGSIADAYSFGRGNIVSLALDHEVREEPAFDLRSSSAILALDRRIFSGSDVRWYMRVGEKFRISEATNIRGAIPDAEETGLLTTSSLFASLVRDARDDIIDPSAGSRSEVSSAYSVPWLGAEREFIEYAARWARYRSLGERWVLAVGARYTTRQVLDGVATLPIQERLFLGGADSVRSFGQDELGPSAGSDPLGGLTAAMASIELRFRLIAALEAASFVDAGSVSEHTWKIARPIGSGIGGGLRYVLPVGPIRVDAAWNPGERFAADAGWAIHAAVGFSF